MSNARNLSKVEVDTNGDIEVGSLGNANDASALTTGTLGSARLPAGSVIQVVSSLIATGYYRSTASSSYLASGLSISITPKKADSKILVCFSGADCDNLVGGRQVYLTIFRDGTVNLGAGSAQSLADYYSDVRTITPLSMSCVDTPNTTSPVTYEMYVTNAQGACYVSSQSAAFTVYAMEIAQ